MGTVVEQAQVGVGRRAVLDPDPGPRPATPSSTSSQGGQFVFATFSGNAADVFGAQVTIAWKFLGVGGGWISFFPDLGVTDYAIAPGDVLWVVSPMDQSILVKSGYSG